ncbi:hypothetical protein LFL96_31830 [Paraburkholderia sp. D15]|uniref:hypothetical protein n=1 Tax=Paraburkholderia sp. D15 TaxID=2880218 RepID=UPI002479CD83|nr:hypothetical protein [Paraburkholderia sp. D15]WGS52773.1 hypothetical protein LFL96_31830 [Paraburkholderia sp. D15]WKF61799.1 hypothetical protein HUO10_006331 [Paraburkholderia busanensis]
MSQTLTFAFQLIAPVLVGLLVTRYLRDSMWRLLQDLCGTSERADFWVRVSAVLMTAAPLALVLLSNTSPLDCSTRDLDCAIDVLRRTCVFMLIGLLAAVGFVAATIRRSIPREAVVVPAARELGVEHTA